MKITWIFLILAIVCALFSDKIDAAFKADQKLKRIILIFSGGILLVCVPIKYDRDAGNSNKKRGRENGD